MHIALINKSEADDKAFPTLADALHAFMLQYAADNKHDASEAKVDLARTVEEVPDGVVRAIVLDKLDVDGALAYHDRDERGNPIIYAGYHVIPNGEIFCGPNGDGASLLGELEHEVGETWDDPFANWWVDMDIVDPQGSGKMFHQVALETVDMVQEIADSFVVNGTKCDRINYGLQAWFDPGAPKGTRVDRMGVLPGPGTLAAGGYAIVRETFSQDGQIFARALRLDHHVPMSHWRAKKKANAHKHSRTNRRLGYAQAVSTSRAVVSGR